MGVGTMSGGSKIIEGLRDAVAGNFTSVTIEGQQWARQDCHPIETAPRDGTEILWTNFDTTTVIKWPVYRECFDEVGSVWMPLPKFARSPAP